MPYKMHRQISSLTDRLVSPRNKEYLIVLIIFFIIARLVIGQLLLSDGTIGLFHDWYIGPYPEMMNQYSERGIYSWDSQKGNVPFSVDWIMRVMSIPFGFLGGEGYSKAIIILASTLSGFTSYLLSRTLGLKSYVGLLVGVIYIFSPIFFTRVIAGYTYYLIAYALAPAILASYLKGYDKGNRKMFLVAGLLMSVTIIQLQFLIMISIILLVICIIRHEEIRIGIMGLGAVLGTCLFITLFPVIVPQIIYPPQIDTFSSSEIYGELKELPVASQLIESFRMLGYGVHPYSYLNLGSAMDYVNQNKEIIPQWVFYVDFIIPIAGFSTLLFKRDKYTLSFAVIALIGLFLVKGPNPPFPDFFQKFFSAGLILFREVWHSIFLYGFAITFLIGLLLNEFSSKIKQPYSPQTILKYSAIFSLALLVAISNGYPLLLGNFAGYVQTYKFPPETKGIYDRYAFNDTFNTLILPIFEPIKYDNLKLAGIDPTLTYSPNMILPSDSAISDIRHPTSGIAIWIMSLMTNAKTDNLGSLLTGLGIKYIILREDLESRFLDFIPQGQDHQVREKWSDFEIQSFLDKQKDLVLIENSPGYKIYENIYNSTKMFIPKLRIGGMSDYNKLLDISNIAPLKEVAAYPSLPNATLLNLMESQDELNLDRRQFIPFGQYAQTEDLTNGWTSSSDSFAYHHILSSRTNSGIFAVKSESNIVFQIPLQFDDNYGTGKLWTKVLEWNKGGEVIITVNGNTSKLSLFSDDPHIAMVPLQIPKYAGLLNISITNQYGSNYLEGVYIDQSAAKMNIHREIPAERMIFVDNGLDELSSRNLIKDLFITTDNDGANITREYYDDRSSCGTIYVCSIDKDNGWANNSRSLKVSTSESASSSFDLNDRWSWIFTEPLDVNPGGRYEFVSQIKVNKFVTSTHVVLEGFNSSSQTWQQLEQCPSAISGPTGWNQYICHLIIPRDFSSLRIGLNAGVSSAEGNMATTYFGGLYLSPIGVKAGSSNQTEWQKKVASQLSSEESQKPQVLESGKLDPTLWQVRTSSQGKFTLAFAEPYDKAWKAIVYKNNKQLEVVDSQPLYDSINSFAINQGGDLDIVIKYDRQGWFVAGLAVSVTCISVCLLLIIHPRRKPPMQDSSSP
jgi:hypothetical protein